MCNTCYCLQAYQSEADRLNLPKWIGRDNGWGWFHELGEWPTRQGLPKWWGGRDT